jgi:Ca-activated chloride channel family protein
MTRLRAFGASARQARLPQGYAGRAQWRAAIFSISVGLLGPTVHAQQEAPAGRLTIVSPPDGSYVSGPVVIQARMTAGPAPRQMTFFADGRSVCTLVGPPFECAWDAGAAIKEHVIRVTATLADGQRVVATTRTKNAGYTETVDVEVVQVTTTVTDASGVFVHGLTRDTFRVREDGVPQKLTAFAGENIPLEVVVAVDVSESMTDAMPILKAAVRGFLAALRPADQVSLLAFNDNIFTLARRSTDPKVRLKAVDRLSPWGGTALYDAILTAIGTVGKQPGRRALVVFTDGEDQNSVSTIRRVQTRLETSDATIFTIGLGRSVTNRVLAASLEHIASMSGGRAFVVDSVKELDKAFGAIVEELSHQYLLSYASSNEARDGSWRKIQVEVTDTSLRVRHRQGYRASGGKRRQP